MQTTRFWRLFSGHEPGESMQNHLSFYIFDHPKGNFWSNKNHQLNDRPKSIHGNVLVLPNWPAVFRSGRSWASFITL